MSILRGASKCFEMRNKAVELGWVGFQSLLKACFGVEARVEHLVL